MEKREAKKQKKEARQAAEPEDQPVDERVLWEQFARLSEAHDANDISLDEYEAERKRILEALGIEP